MREEDIIVPEDSSPALGLVGVDDEILYSGMFEYKLEYDPKSIIPVAQTIKYVVKNAATHRTHVLITDKGLIYAKHKRNKYELVLWGKFYPHPGGSIGIGDAVLYRIHVDGETDEIREKRNRRLYLVLFPQHSLAMYHKLEDDLVKAKGKEYDNIQNSLTRHEKEFFDTVA